MTTLDLLFERVRSLDPADALQLVFGQAGGGVPPPPPPPPPPQPDPRPGRIRSYVAASWAATAGRAAGATTAVWGASSRTGAAALAPWSWTSRRGAALAAAWASTAARVGAASSAPWGAAEQRGAGLRAPWQATTATGVTRRAPWAGGQPARRPVEVPWDGAHLAPPARVAVPWAGGQRAWRRVAASGQDGQRAGAGVRAPWRAGRPVSGTGGPIVLPPAPPDVGCRTDDPPTDLVLRFASAIGPGLPLRLLFSCVKAALIVIPVRSVYMVTNVTSLIRVWDGTAIPCDSFSLRLDVDSWAWGFSANLPYDARSLIAPPTPGAPIELQATIDGLNVRVIAEQVSTSRQGLTASASVSGRGLTALLDAPYAASQVFGNTSALTAAQLIDQALPPGWTSNWTATDWLVPAGAWSHQGTPITAAQAVAAAAGAFLRPFDTGLGWDVVPRYPTGPWDWGTLTPDVSLPSAVAEIEGVQYVDKARYNRVYVAGSGPGAVLARVTRAGTAGDVVAPMISSPLITHADAGRQRGLVALADTGRVVTVSLRMPVLPAAGVLRPGWLVDYVDAGVTRRGIVRSVSVSAAFGNVSQAVDLECNEG